MNVKAWAILFALSPGLAAAQGFAGLGTDATGFALPAPDWQITFPADHGPHPDFRIEWWYLTANLTGPDGADYGLQWTLFRTGLAPGDSEGWTSPQVWFGHAAVTTPEGHSSTERFARGGIGQAGVTAEPFAAWIDDWHMAGDSFDAMTVTASAPDFAYDMALNAEGPLVLQGDAGYSVKSAAGQASYYYSQPFFRIEGTLTLPEGEVAVTGHAWLDHEWSSQPLGDDQTGWDWFSLSFDDGNKLMLFQLRGLTSGSYTAATWINADGTTEAVPDGFATATPLAEAEVAGREIPVRWQVDWPERGLSVEIDPVVTDAWMDLSIAYWEGPVRVTGTHPGIGYLEMTGYD